MSVGVLFVSLGNLCRSPSTHGIFEYQVADTELAVEITVNSCGTAAFNVGKPPGARAMAAAQRAGYDIGSQSVRQIDNEDFRHFTVTSYQWTGRI